MIVATASGFGLFPLATIYAPRLPPLSPYIIYRIFDEIKTSQIHYIGHRKDIYEILKERTP